MSFTATKPHNGAFIVYINGIEVPCKSVTERQGVWQIPEMQLEMVADPVLTRLGSEDRVQVVVFYLDDTVVEKELQAGPTFRLFGEGEITGWGYQNTPSGRSISFTCVNHFAIFTQLFVEFLTTVDDQVGRAVTAGAGGDTIATTTSSLIFPFSLFKEGLVQGTLQEERGNIKRPFDFLYNLLKNMVGKQVPKEQNSIPASNFFARWTRLTNFINRFVATPAFDDTTNGDERVFPILKALQDTAGIDTIVGALIPQVQNKDSIFAMLQLVYQTVFMEVAMLSRMPLVSVDLLTSMIQKTAFESHKLSTTRTEDTSTTVDPRAYRSPTPPINKRPNRLANYFAKPQTLFGLPPACNVVFPSQLSTLAYNENYATQPTRLYFNDQVISNIVKSTGSVGLAIDGALTTGYPPEVDAANKAKILAGGTSNGKNFLLFPEEFYKGPVMDRRSVPPWLFFLKQQEGANQAAAEKGGAPAAVTTSSQPVPAAQDDLYTKVREGSPDVYKLYAQYEYFRERYSQRTGGVNISFNPYVVPGFPALILDNRATRVDLMCYVTTVAHTLSHRSRSTTFSFAYARTIQEMFDIMGKEFAQGASAAGTGPREPLRDIRKVIQDFDESEKFYQRLFYGANEFAGRKASCDWRTLLAYAPLHEGDSPAEIFITGTSETGYDAYQKAADDFNKTAPDLEKTKQQRAKVQAEIDQATEQLQNAGKAPTELPTFQQNTPSPQDISAQGSAVTWTPEQEKATLATLAAGGKVLAELDKQIAAYQKTIDAAIPVINSRTLSPAVSHNLDGGRELVPTEEAEPLFESYDDALAYNWRPICTLDEYIIFHDSTGTGVIPAFGHPQSVGARYFERIRTYTPLTETSEIVRGADGLNTPFVENTGDTLPNGHSVVRVTDKVTQKVTFRDSTTGEQVDPPASKQGAANPVDGATKPIPPKTQTVTGLHSASFPQTRADWDKILLAYRQNVYVNKTPRT